MKTSELIAVLATADSAPVRPAAPANRIASAALVGATAALAILALWLGFQPLAAAAGASWFWMKAGYSLAAATAGFLLLVRLARPGARIGFAGAAVGCAALFVIWMLAAHASMWASDDHRTALWLGETWRVCAFRILVLAAPIYAGVIIILRRLAPTRLALSGAAAGLLAGGLSAVVYGLYCQENAAPFVAAWYSAGIAGSALIGAALGPRLLRW
ncbi:MAG TPA: DUF1109 domain-containing protein [Caulobacteraceae bacterium]